MIKRVGCVLLISLFILSGCTNSAAYKDEDAAAIVRGEKITVGYLRFLYPDDAIVQMTDDAVIAKLAEQEVRKMNIDVSKQIKTIKQSYGIYPQGELNSAKGQSIRAFADPQAEKLGMDPKEYYEQYTEVSAEMVGYVHAYISEFLGELEDDEFGIEEYNHHANELLDDLAEQYKDEIEIRIK